MATTRELSHEELFADIKVSNARTIPDLIAPYHDRGKDEDYVRVVSRELEPLKFDTLEALATALEEIKDLLWEEIRT
jgi:hypothetical protein